MASRPQDLAVRSLADDGAAGAGDYHIDAFATLELVGQHFAAKQAFAPADEAGGLAFAACRQAGADFIGAAAAGVGNAPGDLDRGGRAANGCWAAGRCWAAGGGRAAGDFRGAASAASRSGLGSGNHGDDCEQESEESVANHVVPRLCKWRMYRAMRCVPVNLA